jgi:hypothetical protein
MKQLTTALLMLSLLAFFAGGLRPSAGSCGAAT